MTRFTSKLTALRLSAAAAILLVAVVGLLASQGSIRAAWPTGPTYDPQLNIELSDDSTDANADIVNAFNIPEGDLQFNAIFNFTPPEFFVTEMDDIPLGAHGGDLEALATLGLIDGPCNVSLAVNFTLLVATTDTSDTITFDEQFTKTKGDPQIFDGAEFYPEFLNTAFPTAPIYRLWGMANVSGVLVSMNLVFFEPGASFPGVSSFSSAWGYPSATVLNNPYAPLAPGSITDFCTPLVSDSTVFGLTKDNSTITGDQSGYEQRRNPCAPGTYTFRSWARSVYDADDDGYGNAEDNCPFHPNLEDLRSSTGSEEDPDNDALDSACDPDPDTYDSSDVDLDGYSNRQDNCPLIPDFTNLDEDNDGIGDVCEGDVPETDAFGVNLCDNELDDDGDTVVNDGCPADGDAETTCDEERLTCADADGQAPWDNCDDDGDTVVNDGCPAFGYGDPADPDGTRFERTIEENMSIVGDDVCPVEETPTATATATATPTAALDTDGDTVPDDDEEAFGSDPEDADSTPESLAYDPDTCTDDEDNDDDGDTDGEDDGCADTDGDGFEDAVETELGSDPEDADSTPEDVTVEGSCTDGEDNDGDGDTDAEDDGCAAAAEATETATETATEVAGEGCAPVFPGTYNGLVRIDGVPAPSGSEVVATIDGNEWGSAYVSGGRYAVDVPQTLPTSEPCFEGGTLTFTVNGATCTPSDDWVAGLQDVDIDCTAPAAPTAAPPTTTPPPATATPAATETATPTATPAQPPSTGSGGLGGSGSSLPLWAMALLGWAGLMTMAGLGVLVRR